MPSATDLIATAGGALLPALRRRQCLRAALCTAAAAWGLAGPAQAQPRWTVSREQLQDTVAQRFPRRYAMQDMLDLTLRTPLLALRPATNRLSVAVAVEAAGPALGGTTAGQLEVEFALRYEPSDRTLRAHQLRLLRLQFPQLQPALVELLNLYAPTLAEQALLEVVLHRVQPQELGMLDTLGLQPGALVVTDRGLTVDLVPVPMAR